MRTSRSTITIAICGILLSVSLVGSKAYELAHVHPIHPGQPFLVRMQDLDGTHTQLPPECTRVVITDAFCPGCRSAAHEWREIPGANLVWLVLNSPQQAREYRSMFLEPPRALVVVRGAGRLRTHELLDRMRISGTPKTVVVDSQGIVRDVFAGIASPAVCNDDPGKGEG